MDISSMFISVCFCVSRRLFYTLEPYCLGRNMISFFDPAIKHIDKDYAHVDYSSVCNDVFYCEVEDLDRDYLAEKGYSYDSFFPEAAKVALFIYAACEHEMDIICQCDYGQSRSAGCAAAILEHFYQTGSLCAGPRYASRIGSLQ